MDFVHADMSTFLEWYEVDAMLSVINDPPFFDRGYGSVLASHFPSVPARAKMLCQKLGLRTWEEHPYLPNGYTISVPTSIDRCPFLLLYGKDSTCDAWSVFDGMSSAFRLLKGDSRIGVPCEGSVFGTLPAKESVSDIVRALEAHK